MQTNKTEVESHPTKPDVVMNEMPEISEAIRGTRREKNLMTYEKNRVHVARMDGEIYGAIRSAIQDNPGNRHGFIGDLQVEDSIRGGGLEEQLIREAEDRLFKENCSRIDAVMEDGQGWTRHYAECGYWTARKTVDLAWDLISDRDYVLRFKNINYIFYVAPKT